jgi:hypothetical protein
MDLQSGWTPVGTQPGLLMNKRRLSTGTTSVFLEALPLLCTMVQQQHLHICTGKAVSAPQCKMRCDLCNCAYKVPICCRTQKAMHNIPGAWDARQSIAQQFSSQSFVLLSSDPPLPMSSRLASSHLSRSLQRTTQAHHSEDSRPTQRRGQFDGRKQDSGPSHTLRGNCNEPKRGVWGFA